MAVQAVVRELAEALAETTWFMETADYGVQCTIGPVGEQHNIYQKAHAALAHPLVVAARRDSGVLEDEGRR